MKHLIASVAESADACDSKSHGRKVMGVQVSPEALFLVFLIMDKVFSYFINHYKLTWTIFSSGIVLGLIGLMSLNREARPPVDFARMVITTVHLSVSSPDEIEEFITNKIERELKSISGIKHSRSVSSPGMSQINLFLDLDNIDIQQTVDEVYRAVQNVHDLPRDLLEPPRIFHSKAEEIPIMFIAVAGPDYIRNRTAHELKTLLQTLPDISRIEMQGFQKREYQILLNSQKIKKHSISPSEVVKAVRAYSQDISAGRIQTSKEQSVVKVFAKIHTTKELENIVIRSNFSGKQIFIKDIALVKDAEEEPFFSSFVQDSSAVVLEISKKAKSDIIHTVGKIKKFLSSYETKIDPNIKLIPLFDESERIKNRLNIVTNNALIGMILVLLILLIFLPGPLGVMSALSLPFSILSTVALMASLGITFNIITMCAFVICIGMLVDNSIVISEHYTQLRLQNKASGVAALQAVLNLWKPICATTLTTIIAFLPMLVTKGVMGQFIKWLPIVVSTALLVSLIEGFFLLPCRLRMTLSKKHKKESEWFLKVKKSFENFVYRVLQRKYLSLGLILLVGLSTLMASYFKNRFILFPKENVENYSAVFEVKKSFSLQKMEEKTLNLQAHIEQTLGKKTIKHIYSFVDSLTGKGNTYIDIHRSIARKWDHKEVLKKLRKIPSSDFEKLRFEALRLGPPIGRPVELVLFSENGQQLEKSANEIEKELNSIKGLLNKENSREHTAPEYAVRVDSKILSRLSLNAQSVGYVLKTALHGDIIAETTKQGENFYIRVKYDNEGRSSIDLLKHVFISSPSGQFIPINNVLKWSKKHKGPEIKKHYAFTPAITFFADVDLNKTTSERANNQIQKKITKILKNYPAVSYKQIGERESTKESLSSLMQAGLLAVFGIFAILLLMFNSFSISLLILSNVFLGFIGIQWCFLLHSKPLSFFALIGTVGLAGVVINSAIILVSFIEKLKKKEKGVELNRILAQSAGERLRPIFITTVTTVLGLFPTAYGFGGYDSVLIPITLSLTWGLITGALLTLIWTPCGYAVIHDLSKKLKKLVKTHRVIK